MKKGNRVFILNIGNLFKQKYHKKNLSSSVDEKSTQKVARNFWKRTENQKKLILEIGKKIGVKNWDDWYQVTR
jgi:hypothetical protein